jgi:hypothetical protein
VVLLPPSQAEKEEAVAADTGATVPVLLGQFRNERFCIRCEELPVQASDQIRAN